MVLVATQVKRRRGTTAENDAFTGAEGEIVVDTERHELRVHDGVTQGGFTIPTTETLDFASKSLDNLSATGEARFTNKANTDLSNTPSNIDYVIESQEPTADNGYTWYRKYKSGWVEQGQSRVAVADQVVQITFPIEMADEYYVWSIGRHVYQVTPQTTNEAFMGVTNRTTTGFRIADQWGHTYAWCWQVSGKSAQ